MGLGLSIPGLNWSPESTLFLSPPAGHVLPLHPRRRGIRKRGGSQGATPGQVQALQWDFPRERQRLWIPHGTRGGVNKNKKEMGGSRPTSWRGRKKSWRTYRKSNRVAHQSNVCRWHKMLCSLIFLFSSKPLSSPEEGYSPIWDVRLHSVHLFLLKWGFSRFFKWNPIELCNKWPNIRSSC